MDELRRRSAWLSSLGEVERERGCEEGRGSTTTRLLRREPDVKVRAGVRDTPVERCREIRKKLRIWTRKIGALVHKSRA